MPILLFHHFSSRWIWRGGDSVTAHQGRGRGGSSAKLDGGGGLSSPTTVRSQGVTGRGKFIPLSPILPSSPYSLSGTEFPLTILTSYPNFLSLFFKGFGLLQQASQMQEEAWKLEEMAQQLETEGWGKMREAVAGSEAEGLYELLRGVTLYSCPVPSQPPIKEPQFAPSITISQPPPQESTGPNVSKPAGQTTGPVSSAVPPAPEEAILAHMQPLRIQVGALKGYISAQLKIAKRVHQPHGPLSVPTLGRYAWEWGWCALSVAKPFLTQMSLDITRKPMLTNKGNY